MCRVCIWLLKYKQKIHIYCSLKRPWPSMHAEDRRYMYFTHLNSYRHQKGEKRPRWIGSSKCIILRFQIHFDIWISIRWSLGVLLRYNQNCMHTLSRMIIPWWSRITFVSHLSQEAKPDHSSDKDRLLLTVSYVW